MEKHKQCVLYGQKERSVDTAIIVNSGISGNVHTRRLVLYNCHLSVGALMLNSLLIDDDDIFGPREW